jgi:hypothetical protein
MKTRILLLLLACLPALAIAQWSNDPNQNSPIGVAPGEQSIPKVNTHPSGITYISWFSQEAGNYNVRLQKLDVYGAKMWVEEGLLVSNHPAMTWLTDWDLAVDHDACAVVTFQDIRTESNNVYAYRISPTGEFLWGDNGLALSNNPDFEAAPVVTITSGNNAVFAWSRENTIMIQKISPTGQKLWGEEGIQLQGPETFAWPFLAPVDNDEVVMVFFKQTGVPWSPTKNVFAQRFDANGQGLWGTGIAISSNAAIPAYVKAKILADGNNGAFIAWHRDNGFVFDAHIQHVQANGNLSFPMNGLAVSANTNTHQLDPVMAFEPNSQNLFVFWREHNSNQSQRGIYGQKMSLQGTLLWGDNGKVVVPMQPGERAGLNVALDGGEPIITFYENTGGVNNDIVKAIRLDTNGDPVWAGGQVSLSLVPSDKMHFSAGAFHNGQLVVGWGDKRNDGGDIYAQNLKADGTLGPVEMPSGNNFIAVVNAPLQNKRVVLFDSQDGSLADDNFIDLEGISGTPIDILQVDDRFWITDQTRDRVMIFDMEGNFVDSIGGMLPGSGLDNIRGLGRVGEEVWVTNAGTQNGAPGNAIVRIGLDGAILGHFTVPGSPWKPIVYNGEVLLSFSAAGAFLSQIHRYDFNGNPLGAWNIPGELNFLQQISEMENGHILASAFSNVSGGNQNGVYEYNTSGIMVGPVPGTVGNPVASGPRGNFQLGNENIMWTNNEGIHIVDISTGVSNTVMSGGSRYFSLISLETVPPVLAGDANCDGIVNVLDIITIASYIMGLNPEPFCFENADVNGDTLIDVLDVIGTANIIMGGE